MSHGKQESMESGRYNDIIHHDVIHFDITKMGVSQNYRWKIHLTFAINLHIFWFDFSKAIKVY